MNRITALLFVLAFVVGASSLHAQDLDGLTIESTNPGEGGFFGRAVAGVPDADGDGGGDLLIGASQEDGGAAESGRAYLLNGAGATLLLTLISPNPEGSGGFGSAVAGVPDTDGDGRGDLLVGAAAEDAGASNSGRAYLFSGATGTLLITLVSPNAKAFGGFGGSVAGVPDADGDGRGDLLVGAYSEDAGAEGSGQAYLFSGATGALLWTLTSPNAVLNGLFGTSVSGVPDADGDGRGDLLVGAEVENGGADGSGRAYLFSGATGALLASLTSPNPEPFSQFGNSVSGVADTDGDGRGDLLVGAVTAGTDFGGRAHLFSGATASLLFTLTSTDPNPSNFGRSVAGVRDIDGDGRGELLIGAAEEAAGAPASGRAYLFNGATGELLARIASLNPESSGQFGTSVAGVPDVDGDGGGDLLVGAFGEDVGAPFTNDGRAYVFYTAVLVSVEDGSGIPESLALAGGYPNPTRGAATFYLTLGAAQPVNVTVYDALGRLVATRQDGILAAGTHALQLDATRFPAGEYFVRATSGKTIVTQRLTVLR